MSQSSNTVPPSGTGERNTPKTLAEEGESSPGSPPIAGASLASRAKFPKGEVHWEDPNFPERAECSF